MEITSVKRDIWIRGSIEKVWKALTVAEERMRWDAWKADIDYRIGGKVWIQHGWGAVTSGVISEIVEQEKFVVSSVDGDFHNITTLVSEDDGVHVTVEYRMHWAAEATMQENMAFGTYRFMENLKSVMEEEIDLRPQFWPTWLGVTHTTQKKDDLGLGTRIIEVKHDSPAEKAGLRVGDVIMKARSESITSHDSLEMVLQRSCAGDMISLEYIRDGNTMSVKVILAAYPRPYIEEVTEQVDVLTKVIHD